MIIELCQYDWDLTDECEKRLQTVRELIPKELLLSLREGDIIFSNEFENDITVIDRNIYTGTTTEETQLKIQVSCSEFDEEENHKTGGKE